MLHHVFNKIWNKEVIPVDWQRVVIVKLPKKGNLEVCDNWRGVTLLSVPGKVLCRIIIDRIKEEIKNVLRKEQAVFRTGRSCIDPIFILRNIIEQCVEWKFRWRNSDVLTFFLMPAATFILNLTSLIHVFNSN